MMNWNKKIAVLIILLRASVAYAEDKPIRMLDHCPGGKGCPEPEYTIESSYDEEKFEITESDFFPVKPRWEEYFESDVRKSFRHNPFGEISLRVSGLDCEANNYIVVEIINDKPLKVEDVQQLISVQEITDLVASYKSEFVYFIRIENEDKHHECAWFLADDAEEWEVTCAE